MSQGFEKETKTSIVKSLLGAFSGLGAGFVLLFLGLAALANARSVVHSSEIVRPVREQLEADLMSALRPSFQLASDGKTLRFQVQTESGVEKLSYFVDDKTGSVRRDVNGVGRHLVTLPSATFRSQNGMLVLSWRAREGQARCSWAIDRWATRPKR